tara:strand:- start:45 stop:338 length:294 start_codon:yes stop_codon:yes gene_type:complete
MRLKNKISKLIDVIKDTDINEIEISSFWGAQKIKLRKNIQEKSDHIQNADIKDKTKNVDIPIDNTQENTLKEKNNENLDIQDDNFEKITAPLVGTFY